MHRGDENKKKPNPKDRANILSRLTFFFTWPILEKGYKKDLTEEDIYEVPSKFRSSELGDQLEKEWRKELKKKHPSLYRLLWRCYGRRYLLLGLIDLVLKLVLILGSSRALGRLVNYFTTNSKLTRKDAVFWGVILVLLNVCTAICSHNYQFWITELGIKLRTSLSSLVYRKSLRLSTKSMADIGVGKIVTLISKDVSSFESAVMFLNEIWIGAILIVAICGLMYMKVGVAALAGTLFLVMVIPVQVFLGKVTSDLRLKASTVTDRRLQVTQETLSVIKTIKMYTWEAFFDRKISQVRKEEMAKIRQIYWVKAVSLVLSGLAISLTLYIVVMTYIHMGNNFTAEVSFTILQLLNGLRPVFIFVPAGISQFAEIVAAIHRIRKVLMAAEQQEGFRKTALKPSVELQEVSVDVNNTLVLRGVNLKIDSGLNVVAGRVGCGKTALLRAILGDYSVVEGKIKVNGTVSYAPEQPWLFPSSIRQNILFGQKYDKDRYHKVLEVCALVLDIGTFERGDDTIIGDRGINLSRGQQERINLARAVYCESDIYLIDNCLASLDTQVQKFVFTQCIKKILCNKMVIMVSEIEDHLKEADNIIYMEHGTVKFTLKPEHVPQEDNCNLAPETISFTDHLFKEIEDDNEDTKLLKPDTPNIYHETKKVGQVSYKVYTQYFKFGGGVLVLLPLLAMFILAQFMMSYSEVLVGRWTNIQQNISEYKFKHDNVTDDLEARNSKALTLYSVAILTSTALVVLRALTYFTFASRASVGLHKRMCQAVVGATMKFFDSHYIGNILNRFSKDLAVIDEVLPLSMYDCMTSLCRIFGILVIIFKIQWMFIFPAFVVFFVMFLFRRWYLPTGRSLKRLDAATRSPMVGHINASLEGLTTIRAHGTQEVLKMEFDHHQDVYTSASYMMQSTFRAFAWCLDTLANFFVIAIVVRFVVEEKDTLPGYVGLAINQALRLPGMVQGVVRQWADLENQMTSVERVLEYTNVDQEDKSGRTIDKWPPSGKILYKQVNLSYGTSKERVLKNISFTAYPGEKISVIGRTGAGKSSLISALFRLYQYEGTISIDNVNITTLSLHFLRSIITIIPQDPILFTGTIRSNIDPLTHHHDDEIWTAISSVNLKGLIPSLDYNVSDGGVNFSSGQKQLVCLARALLAKSKIVVLDEATASVDPDTEMVIFNVVTEKFADCTVLTIAHRLQTVVYADKIMVIDKGEIVEFDNPNKLLTDRETRFYKMISQTSLLS